MIQILVNLLTPFFTSLGVSATDVQTYANSLSGYLSYLLFGPFPKSTGNGSICG
ncbi:MAG: hypothetical protein ACI3VN_10495 [Candidatus Onthomonas sp.]